MRVSEPDVSPVVLADPLDPAWQDLPGETVPLTAAPVGDQPSYYVRSVYAATAIGRVRQVDVRVARGGDEIFIRLQWDDPTENRQHEDHGFPDAAAVMFPVHADASLKSMGSPEQPVALWFWRPDLADESEELVARGLGTVEPVEGPTLSARSGRIGDSWAVVFRRVMALGGPDRVELQPGATSRVAFAVWEGSAGERAGIKAVSRDWIDLDRQNGDSA